MNPVIAVAHDASTAAAGRGKDRLVGALVVKLLEQDVAASAHRGYRFHLRRLGAVIPVTRRALGSREVAPLCQGTPVDAGEVLLELIRRDTVFRHPLGVGMAAPAGVRNVQRINRGHAVFDGADIVNAVAINAGGDVLIPGSEAFAVDAGLVKLELIDALLRAEAAHEVRIAVTFRAELRNRHTARLAEETLGLAHRDRWIVAGAVAAVTIGATQSVRSVDVVFDE